MYFALLSIILVSSCTQDETMDILSEKQAEVTQTTKLITQDMMTTYNKVPYTDEIKNKIVYLNDLREDNFDNRTVSNSTRIIIPDDSDDFGGNDGGGNDGGGNGSYTTFGPWGGIGGSSFQSLPPSENYRLFQVIIRSGKYIDAIEFVWTDGINYVSSGMKGGTGGSYRTFYIPNNQLISKVTGRSGLYIDRLTFHLTNGLIYQFGLTGGSPFTADFGNSGLQGMFGRSGKFVDQIGFYVR
jgi:hypothetical protein